MNNEVQAALYGAVVGGILTFAVTYFIEIKKDREKRRVAIELFKFLHAEWKAVELLDRGKASQKRDYELLLNTSEQIRPAIIDSSCEKIITAFLKYTSTLKQLNGHIQVGNLGLVNWPVDEIQKIYSSFEQHSAQESCYS
ncbi:MAG: hypothetical protein K2X47_12235 [Bdellovibrionales bacterium]|nr:hypothetical protein [Bdellovibrionales bacterium]